MAEASEFTEDELAVWREFFWMRRRLDLALERQLQRDSDISGADYEILASLSQAPDRRLRVRELGESLGWEKSRVSHQLTRMEKRSLVQRLDCATDARGTWVVITADGRRTILGAMRNHRSAIRKVFFDVLEPHEQESLLTISGRVLSAIDAPNSTTLPVS
jgi:DNA-binding MarR family transcriptional regulator